MHINGLPVAFLSVNDGGYEYEGVFGDKVSYTSFVFVAVASVGCDVEFEGRGDRGEEEDEREEEGGETPR